MVSVLVDGVAADGHNIPRPLAVTHGRSEVGFQPEAPSTEFEWWAATCPYTVGDDVKITDAGSTHFGGTIAAVEAVSQGGQVTSWRISAVGYLAQWGLLTVVATRPAETDVARVQAIAAAVGRTIVVDGAAGVRLVATEIDGDALSALHEVCTSSGGLVWQARDGAIHYTTAAYRVANQGPTLSVRPDTIEDALAWQMGVEDIVNKVTVAYGPDTARAEITAQHNQSVLESWGVRALQVDTLCETEPAAEQIAALILARRAYPFWGSISALITIDPPDEVLFATADVNTVVLLPIPHQPDTAPLVTPEPWVLEGWVEEWTEAMEHTATLAVSDQRRWVTTSERTYSEVLAGGTYQHWLDQGSYIDLLVKTT